MQIIASSPLEQLDANIQKAFIDEYAVYMLDPNGLIISWEPGIAKMKGYSAQEVLGKHFSIFRHDLDMQTSTEALREAVSCGKHSSEGWRWRKDQSKFYACITIIPLIDARGHHFGFANITRNITEQHQTYERLHNNLLEQSELAHIHERRLRLITDTLPHIVSEFDTNLIFRFANKSCQRYFGKTESELIGRRLKDELDAETYEAVIPYAYDALEGKPVSFERETSNGGITRCYLVEYVPEFNHNGTVVGLMSVATDITQLKEAKLAAESANNAKSSFLANMAHEIRTPLGAVLGFSELLLKDNLSGQDKKIYQSAIVRNGSLLSNIINDVLDFAKIEAGMLQIDLREVHIVEILGDTLSTLEFHAHAKNIKLKTSIDGNTPRTVHTDPSRLKQILLNIVGNAIKFTENGTIMIRVEPTANHECIRFIVEDSGIGVSPDQAAKLFMPFKQSEDFSRRKFSGTGLGLALSRQMAQLLGGDVQLTKTELGKGSIFTIIIKSSSRPDRINEVLDKTHKGFLQIQSNNNQPDLSLNGAKILLVEDSPDNQILVSRILKNAGADVVSAHNGVEALSQTEVSKFDVIVMDLQMPIMDGYQAAQALRNRGDKTPIVALSAHAMREEHDRCLAVGINAHLAKPINTHKLVATLAQQCHLH